MPAEHGVAGFKILYRSVPVPSSGQKRANKFESRKIAASQC